MDAQPARSFAAVSVALADHGLGVTFLEATTRLLERGSIGDRPLGRPAIEVVDQDGGRVLGAGPDQPAAHDVLEVAHIAGPLLGLQPGHRVRRQRDRGDRQGLGGPTHQRVGQQGEVAGALVEGRHPDAELVQPVEQVLAEPTVGHRLLGVHVGGRDHADVVGVAGLGLADPTVHAVLEEGEQLSLHLGWERVHLVEEERAALGSRHQAVAVLGEPGVRARLGAEQVDQRPRLREVRAVDRHEGALGSTVLVDHAGHFRLARARGPGDQHGDGQVRTGRDLIQHDGQGCRAPHEPVGLQAATHLAGLVGAFEAAGVCCRSCEGPEVAEELLETTQIRGCEGPVAWVRQVDDADLAAVAAGQGPGDDRLPDAAGGDRGAHDPIGLKGLAEHAGADALPDAGQAARVGAAGRPPARGARRESRTDGDVADVHLEALHQKPQGPR